MINCMWKMRDYSFWIRNLKFFCSHFLFVIFLSTCMSWVIIIVIIIIILLLGDPDCGNCWICTGMYVCERCTCTLRYVFKMIIMTWLCVFTWSLPTLITLNEASVWPMGINVIETFYCNYCSCVCYCIIH